MLFVVLQQPRTFLEHPWFKNCFVLLTILRDYERIFFINYYAISFLKITSTKNSNYTFSFYYVDFCYLCYVKIEKVNCQVSESWPTWTYWRVGLKNTVNHKVLTTEKIGKGKTGGSRN